MKKLTWAKKDCCKKLWQSFYFDRNYSTIEIKEAAGCEKTEEIRGEAEDERNYK